ncbi:MAG TPA: hypothetical protein PLU82_03905, partial [Oscillospiraceae bacterium]|nr:hypothetical protein [Oscillospiraceae bacterium]
MNFSQGIPPAWLAEGPRFFAPFFQKEHDFLRQNGGFIPELPQIARFRRMVSPADFILWSGKKPLGPKRLREARFPDTHLGGIFV